MRPPNQARPPRPFLISLALAAGVFFGADHLAKLPLPPDIRLWAMLGLKLVAVIMAVDAVNRALFVVQEIALKIASVRKSRLKGSADWLSEREARKAGLARQTAQSRLLGILGQTALWVASETHQLILGPSGSQKSSAAFLNALCSIQGSVLVNDTKKELYTLTARFRRKYLGHRIVLLDPDDPTSACVNPLDLLADLIAANKPKALTFARALSFQLKPDPAKADQNPFFTKGARILLTTLICAIAAVCTEDRRTLATVTRALSDANFLHELLERAMAVTVLDGAIAEMANDVHMQAFGDEGSAKTYEQFRIGALQVVEIYAKGGPLARITSKTTFDFGDLKREKISAYLVVDFANKDAAGPWAGMMQWLATWQLVQVGNNKPVHLLLDECCNAPVYGLPTVLTLLRSYGVRVTLATQDLDDFTRVYDKHALETILSETVIKQFLGGIRSQTTLDYLSKYLGNATETAPSYALEAETIRQSHAVSDRPLMTSDELRRLDTTLQIVLVGNLKPVLMRKVQVFAVAPWRRRIGINTAYGRRRYLLPVEMRLRWWGAEVTRRGRMVMPRRHRISYGPVLLFALRKLAPAQSVLFLGLLVVMLLSQGAPYLRVAYRAIGPDYARTYLECVYIGPRPFRSAGPDCPVIVLRKHN